MAAADRRIAEARSADRIAATLRHRRDFRRYVANLVARCRALGACVDEVRAATATAERASAVSPDPAMASPVTSAATALFAADLATVLDIDAGGQTGLDRMRRRLAEIAEAVGAVAARVDRDTVNLGVIGRAKAGKSTLLRSISGLDATVIPSHRNDPTTAARSRIHHRCGPGEALLLLHDWDSFRDEYLRPLHARLALEPVPQTPDGFLAYRYPSPETFESGGQSDHQVSAVPYLRKLRQAQESFPGYRELLERPERRMTVPLPQLPPYVAYPMEDGPGPQDRPYHAVHDVWLYHQFPRVDNAALVLVDLPGAGEAGLDIDRQFLAGVVDETDMLLHVKRPDTSSSYFTGVDIGDLQLAQNACGDMNLADFAVVIVNRDGALGQDSFDHAVRRTNAAVAPHQVKVLVCDAADPTAVHRQVVLPLLDHLAHRLSAMDLSAITGVASRVRHVGQEAAELMQSLVAICARWRDAVPDDQARLRQCAVKLQESAAKSLAEVCDRYDALRETGARLAGIDDAISEARGRVRAWLQSGFGVGSRAAWEGDVETAMHTKPDAERERRFNLARQHIALLFGSIDGSVDVAVERLWHEMADALRRHLGPGLVPNGMRALTDLQAVAEKRSVLILARALADLIGLRANYGSLYLRVGRPIVNEISTRRQALRAAIPSQSAAEQRAAADWWVAAAALRSVPATSAAVAAHDGDDLPLPLGPDSRVETAKRDAATLYDELTSIVEQTADQLCEHLRHEALSLVKVLAATAEQFHDMVARTPGIEYEFERLCAPERDTIWPDVFAGPEHRLNTAISQLHGAARSAGVAAADLDAAAATPLPRPDPRHPENAT